MLPSLKTMPTSDARLPDLLPRGALLLVTSLLFLVSLPPSHAALFPGLSPNDFNDGESLNIFATKLISHKNRLPYDYYTLPFCRPTQEREASHRKSKDSGRLGIGQILQGERSRLTAYDVTVPHNIDCRNLCTTNFTRDSLNLLANRIAKAYRVRLILDDLPVVVRTSNAAYHLGYPLGMIDKHDRVLVVNHLAFTIMYHVPDTYEALTSTASLRSASARKKVFRIVGFEVQPVSLAENTCPAEPGAALDLRQAPFLIKRTGRNAGSAAIPFSYSVRFVQSHVRWAVRYDPLLKVSTGRQRVQVFAIINSLMLALFLTALLAGVLLRTLRRDCARYGLSSSDLMDELHDDFDLEVGWRALRGDVFRAPAAAGMLSVLCGSGAQVLLVSAATLVFAMLGIVSPHRRGNLLTGLLFLWVLSSGIGGYVAARLHKAMGGVRWKLVTFGVALVLPGIAFTTFFIVNLFMWIVGSTGAAPLLTMIVILVLWLGVSVPLAFIGTYLGYQRKAYDFPVRTNQIPRPIPRQPSYLRAPGVHLVSGLLPFMVVCIELRVILNSIYLDEFYHFFGFLVAMFSILAITCAEVSVVVVFVKLNNCDYGWWWNSWLASASSGVYVLLYSVFYLLTSPGADAKNIVSNFLFLAYSTLGSLCFALLTGSVGFLSSLAFVRRIYSDSSLDD